MPQYTDLLKQREWTYRCNEILNRDKYTCQHCGHIGFHNDDTFMCLNSIKNIYPLFNNVTIDGKSFHEFLHSLSDYEYEEIEDIDFYEDDISYNYDNTHRVWLYLHSKKSKHFCNRWAKPHRITTDIVFHHECGMGALLFNKLNINEIKTIYSWTYIINCNKPVSDKIYVSISGSNDYAQYNEYLGSEYQLCITKGHQIIIFSFLTNDIFINGLNIHHKYYIRNHNPWEYSDTALITLCEKCHKKVHESETISMVDESGKHLFNTILCKKCGGSGYLPQYSHIANGICFDCGGEGVILND